MELTPKQKRKVQNYISWKEGKEGRGETVATSEIDITLCKREALCVKIEFEYEDNGNAHQGGYSIPSEKWRKNFLKKTAKVPRELLDRAIDEIARAPSPRPPARARLLKELSDVFNS